MRPDLKYYAVDSFLIIYGLPFVLFGGHTSTARTNRETVQLALPSGVTSFLCARGSPPNYNNLSYFPIPTQLSILSALNNHLRDELEQKEERHTKALADLLRRLRESERVRDMMHAHLESGISVSQVDPIRWLSPHRELPA